MNLLERLHRPVLSGSRRVYADRRVYIRDLLHPGASRDTVYQYYDAAIRISLPRYAGQRAGRLRHRLGVIICVLLAGLMASLFAYLIGLPVLRLKSDYLAIATLGFAEIIRAIFQWGKCWVP